MVSQTDTVPLVFGFRLFPGEDILELLAPAFPNKRVMDILSNDEQKGGL